MKDHKDLDRLISKSIYRAFKKQKSGMIFEQTIGITFLELKKHIEEQFDESMNWNNYGSYWVVDKIIPTRFYRYSDHINGEFKKAWNIKNFRPLERIEHNRRPKTIEFELVNKYNLFDILPIGNYLTKINFFVIIK